MRARVRAWTAVPTWAKPAVGGVVVAALGTPFPAVLGIGYATLSNALLGNVALTTMASLSVVKLAATVASYGFGLSGGIFAPSLYVGGMLGGALGASLHPWVPQNPNIVGSFALVGMGALFAGAIRAPITSILIIFEMTGDYAIILPLMIANMISYTLASYWQPVPIYEALLEQDGLHAGDHDVAVFRRTAIDRAMTRRVVTAAPHEPVDAVLRRLDELGRGYEHRCGDGAPRGDHLRRSDARCRAAEDGAARDTPAAGRHARRISRTGRDRHAARHLGLRAIGAAPDQYCVITTRLRPSARRCGVA
jgi:hypothetical protein